MRTIGKKGVTSVLEIVFMIFIIIAIVLVIWAVVFPLVKQGVSTKNSCSLVDISIDEIGGYTCYEPNNITLVQVKKGSNEVNITSLKFYLNANGSSIYYQKDYVMGKNSVKVFYLNSSDLQIVEKIKIIPVMKEGVSEKDCSEVSLTLPPICDVGNISGAQVLQPGTRNSYTTIAGGNEEQQVGCGFGDVIGTAINSCQTLDVAGDYTLTQNIGSGGSCLIINASDINIYGDNCTVDGNIDGSGDAVIDNVFPSVGEAGNNFNIYNLNVLGEIYSIGLSLEVGNNGGAGGQIGIYNSSVGYVSANGGSGSVSGNGGQIFANYSSLGNISVMGATSDIDSPGDGGIVYLYYSNASNVFADAGEGNPQEGGSGGNVQINFSIVSGSISSAGSSGPYLGGSGGNVLIIGEISQTGNILLNGGNGSIGAAGNGGSISFFEPCPNLDNFGTFECLAGTDPAGAINGSCDKVCP